MIGFLKKVFNRLRYGFSVHFVITDRYCDLDHIISAFIAPRLRKHKERIDTYPTISKKTLKELRHDLKILGDSEAIALIDNKDLDNDIRFGGLWEIFIDYMIWSFEFCYSGFHNKNESMDEYKKDLYKYNFGLKLFSKYFNILWEG